MIPCYAIEGKAYIFHPILGEQATIILMNPERETLEVASHGRSRNVFASDGVPAGDWRILGWRPLNGIERHGPYDAVDPELADFANLRNPALEPELGASVKCHPDGSPLINRK